jgi:putative hydrolase of the HAD superfamily
MSGTTANIELVLFDIGGVLGSNGWDGEQRQEAVKRFGLDAADFQYRHEETVGALEEGMISLDEYLDITIFSEPRAFTREEFKQFMLAQSEPWEASIGIARRVAQAGRVRMATLNNESEELNVHRITRFGLHDIFPTFFTSCWLGMRKPTRQIYARALGMTQADPRRTVFVDDRLQNLVPARTLGMRTIHFRSAEQLQEELSTLDVL